MYPTSSPPIHLKEAFLLQCGLALSQDSSLARDLELQVSGGHPVSKHVDVYLGTLLRTEKCLLLTTEPSLSPY